MVEPYLIYQISSLYHWEQYMSRNSRSCNAMIELRPRIIFYHTNQWCKLLQLSFIICVISAICMALNLYTVLRSFFWCNFYGRLSLKIPSHFLFENIDYVCDLRNSTCKSVELPKISFFQPRLVR